MPTTTYLARREQLLTYFDRTAAEAWSRLTSDVPVSGIRATVRAGRDTMRATLLSWLPEDLEGRRILDAGCGTGALAVEAARRGAEVVATDLSPALVKLAQERAPDDLDGSIDFHVGDMLDPSLGRFDHVVAMDSLIHYPSEDVVRTLADLAGRCDTSILFTFAPRTVLLTMMHTAGRFFPRSDRAPAIEPVGENRLRTLIAGHDELAGWSPARTLRVANGFYTSQAMELQHAGDPP